MHHTNLMTLERLPSFYTVEEVKFIMNAVDRSTPWGKTSTL